MPTRPRDGAFLALGTAIGLLLSTLLHALVTL